MLKKIESLKKKGKKRKPDSSKKLKSKLKPKKLLALPKKSERLKRKLPEWPLRSNRQESPPKRRLRGLRLRRLKLPALLKSREDRKLRRKLPGLPQRRRPPGSRLRRRLPESRLRKLQRREELPRKQRH